MKKKREKGHYNFSLFQSLIIAPAIRHFEWNCQIVLIIPIPTQLYSSILLVPAKSPPHFGPVAKLS